MTIAETSSEIETQRQNAQRVLETAGFTEIRVVSAQEQHQIWLEGGTVSRRQEARRLLKHKARGSTARSDFR